MPVETQKSREVKWSVRVPFQSPARFPNRLLRLTYISLDDVARSSSAVKNEISEGEKEGKKTAEEWAQRAGSKLDSTVSFVDI